MKKVFCGLIAIVIICGAAVAEITNYKRVCYYGSWEFHNPGIDQFSPDDIVDTSICTHYIYSFAGVDSTNRTIIPLDEIDETENGYQKLTNKKQSDPTIKVILAIGGWSFGVEEFEQLANSTESIDEFCVNAIKYLRKWKFDGVDVDWEYPTQRGGTPVDKENFATLLEKLRYSFEEESYTTGNPRLLLSSAVPMSKYYLDQGYDAKRIGKAVDFLNIMVYDLFGGWSATVGHHAPLYRRTNQTSAIHPQLNADWGMEYWAKEVSKEKLILGVPIYARTYTINTTVHTPGDWNLDAGIPFAKSGTIKYRQICTLILDGTLKEDWDEEQQAAFAYSDTQWAGYDNERSLKEKANFVKDNQYGGIMVWQLPGDDFSGLYCGKGKFPIMNAIKNTLTGSRDDCKVDSYGFLNKLGCKPCPLYTYQPRSGQTSCVQVVSGPEILENPVANTQCQGMENDDLTRLQVIIGVFGGITIILLLLLILIACKTYRRVSGEPSKYKL